MGLWDLLFFSGQNSQLAGEISSCPDVSAGHFQKLFWAMNCNPTVDQKIQQLTNSCYNIIIVIIDTYLFMYIPSIDYV